jgi:glycine/D-amino acid oxidase-like deaminating enzyme
LQAPLDNALAAKEWVRAGGDARDSDRLTLVLAELLPDVQVHDVATRPCLVTINASSYPYIGFVDDDIVVATEGDHGVTMADEIGRLAARLSIDGAWHDTLPPEPFLPKFA